MGRFRIAVIRSSIDGDEQHTSDLGDTSETLFRQTRVGRNLVYIQTCHLFTCISGGSVLGD